MLQADAPGTNGNLLFLGFVPTDLAHLTADKPIVVERTRFSRQPIVLLYETDPMVGFYAQQPWAVVVLVRKSTIDAMKASDGFVDVPLAHPGVDASTTAMLFFAATDEALIARLRATGLAMPDAAAAAAPAAGPVARSESTTVDRGVLLRGAAGSGVMAALILGIGLNGPHPYAAAGLGLFFLGIAAYLGFLLVRGRG